MSDVRELTTPDGTRLSYHDSGNGSPLLLVHGWLMSHRVWTCQSPLADRFRIIAPDLRGHGCSDVEGFSYNACVADLVMLVEHLGLEKTVIVGWSMGVQIALRAWPLLRDRIAAFMLVGGTPRFCADDGYVHGIPHAEARGMALRLRRNFVGTAGEFYRGMFSSEDRSGNDTDAMAKRVVSRLPRLPVALAALDELVSADLRDMLGDVTVPVLLVHGESDRICLPGASRYMQEKLPDSRLQLLPGVGHAPFLVRPTEFNEQLALFAGGVYGAD